MGASQLWTINTTANTRQESSESLYSSFFYRAEQPQPSQSVSQSRVSNIKLSEDGHHARTLAVKLAINDRWNSSPSMHLSRTRKTSASLYVSRDGGEQQAPLHRLPSLSYADILKMVEQISAERSESDFLTPEQSTIHHYCGSGSYLPPQISRCLVDKAITIIALSANTITLGMSTPQHN